MDVNFKYNTQREPIILREYGRSIQKLVNYICEEPDREKRHKMAASLKTLIEKLSTGTKESTENSQRIWDDLHIISDFKLDVDSPYSPPDREMLYKKPRKMAYPQSKSFSRYGKNIEKLVKNIIERKDAKEHEKGTIYLGRLINTFHSSWKTGSIDKVGILKSIEQISGKKLTLPLERVEKENLFEKLAYDNKRSRSFSSKTQKKERKSNEKKYGGGSRK